MQRNLESPSVSLAVLQPSYLPWLGYLEQMASVDHFVFLDDVQFDKNGWRNRNRILVHGAPHWLTVPVRPKSSTLLKDISIVGDSRWAVKHLETIRHAYRRSPGTKELLVFLEAIFAKNYERLCDLNVDLLRAIHTKCGFQSELHLNSQLQLGGERTERLVRLCEHFGVSEYLTGQAAREYLDERAFEAIGVTVQWHEFRFPSYPQPSPTFVPFLSMVDAVCAIGFDGVSLAFRGE